VTATERVSPKMERLIKVLNSVDENTIKTEVEGQKIKNSQTLNAALKKEYTNFPKTLNSKTLLLRIWNFTITGTGIPREGTISRIWLRLYKALDRIIKALYSNENTMEGTCTEFRKVVRTKFGDTSEIYKQSIYNLGVSQERSKERKQEYADKVKVRNASRGTLQPIYVEDVRKVIQKLKQSPDPYEKSIAVLLATGSRSIELFKVSKYYEVKDDPTKITVKGIAKDKGNNNLDNVVLTRNLVGLNGREVVEIVHDIRDELNLKGTNSKISSLTNTALNKAFKANIQPLAPEYPMSSHKSRYIAGNISYLIYGKPAKIPYESYLQEQYGHLSGESTKSYLGINIQFRSKLIAKAPDDLKILFEREIKELKEQINTNCPDRSQSVVDLDKFKNSHRRTLQNADKIQAVVEALKVLKEKKIKMTQKDLRAQLGYSGGIMSAAYKQARDDGII
jgi:hypothetical protein